MDNLTDHLEEIARRRGIDLQQLAASVPSPLDPAGWVHEDPVAFRTELVYRILEHEADGEFQPDQLPPLHAHVKEWVKQQKADRTSAPRLVLYGATGSGKTSQAFNAIIELAMHAARKNLPYRWRYVSHRAFSAEARDFGSTDDAVEKYMDVDLLVLDDLGAFNATPFAVDCLSRIVDHRYQHRLATIYPTNLLYYRTQAMVEEERRSGQRIAVLSDVLDERLISRLRASWHVNLGSVDHRAKRGRVLR